jgi:hypothetical protein
MKILRVICSIICFVFIALVIRNAERITQLGIVDGRLGWMNSFLIPLGLILLLVVLLLCLLLPLFSQSKQFKGPIAFLALILTFGAHFLVNRSSPDDWIGTGTDLSTLSGTNPVQDYLKTDHPGFNGLFCFAMPGCLHCELAVPRLAVLKDRKPEMDVMIFVFSTDTAEFEGFKQLTGLTNVPYEMVPDPMASIVLCEGSFPSFFYFKEGKIAYRWFNEEFGYPALDRVENDFN